MMPWKQSGCWQSKTSLWLAGKRGDCTPTAERGMSALLTRTTKVVIRGKLLMLKP